MDTRQAASEPPTLIHRPENYFVRMDLAQLFAVPQPLEVELGAGDGSFLIAWAGAHPEHNFLGVERLLGRLRKIDRKGRRAGFTHLRALRIEASYFVEWMLPPGSVTALHIYFPDPWPKRKHRVHRLINAHFTGVAAQALGPGGKVYLRTDDLDYHRQMTEVFGADARFRAADTPAELRTVVTDFERDFNARGVETRYAAYEKTAGVTA